MKNRLPHTWKKKDIVSWNETFMQEKSEKLILLPKVPMDI